MITFYGACAPSLEGKLEGLCLRRGWESKLEIN